MAFLGKYRGPMGSDRNGKVVSKYHRLRLTDDIRKHIHGLPVVDLEETQVGNHVYMANGRICLGLEQSGVKIRIAHRDGQFKLTVKSGNGLDLELPYDTPEERDVAPKNVRISMESLRN